MHQLTELNRTTEETRSRHDEREHHCSLAKPHCEPGQIFLLFEQVQVVAQHGAKAQVQLGALHFFALVQRDGFAVFPHANHVVAEISLQALLLKTQLDQRAANIVADDAAQGAVQTSRPHHEAGDIHRGVAHLEIKVAAQAPQNPHKTGQRNQRVEQPHGERHGVAGELVHVLLNALVGVVGIGGGVRCVSPTIGLRGVTRQLHPVKRLVGQPAPQVVVGHPGPPAHLQQLRQVELVHRDDDEAKRQVGEAPQLRPEDISLLVLQCVVEHPVPVVDQHQHVHRAQIQDDDGGQQCAGLPFFFRLEVGQGQRPDFHSLGFEGGEFGHLGHRYSSKVKKVPVYRAYFATN